jgi:hypothetical protein
MLFNKIVAQDSLPYILYSDKLVLYSDFGVPGSPFKFDIPISSSKNTTLKYKSNPKTVVGFGIAYKWFSARLGISSRDYLLSTTGFGTSKYFDVGLDFSVKNFFYDFDLHVTKGYAITHAKTFTDTINVKGNVVKPNTITTTISNHLWYFQNKNIKMRAMLGKTGRYLKSEGSFFAKGIFAVLGVEDKNGIGPQELNVQNISKTSATNLLSWDLGFIPGYVYVHHYKGFQISTLFGVGAVTQLKGYQAQNINRIYVGLAPRVDFKLMTSYHRKKWFITFLADLDRKSIKFGNLHYKQSYYLFRFTLGFRLL